MKSLSRALLLKSLEGIRDGHLELHLPGGGMRSFGDPGSDLHAVARICDESAFRRFAFGGDIAFGETYAEGLWTSPDLPAVTRLAARNMAAFDAGGRLTATLDRWLERGRHLLRRNSVEGSRENIRFHYDLGTDFYSLFLDPTLTYSCALFDRPGSTLADAQVAKFDRIARKLELSPGDRLLEIGSGWGSFAIHAATQYGCRVTTTTISEAQRQMALERVRAAGLSDRIEVLGTDYRDLSGTFDRLVSIEMIEAVGHANLPAYFQACADRLRPDGAMLLQAITMPDRDYQDYLESVDYIQRYVFPGSSLPSLGAITRAVARTDLRVDHVESISHHYGETLRRWRRAFTTRLAEVRALGFDERFVRLWTYYLCYCEAGFEERYVDNLQIVLARPGWETPARLRGATDPRSAPSPHGGRA